MEHLRWRLDTTITYRPDFVQAMTSRKTATAPPVTLSKTSHADVWIAPSQSWYRIESVNPPEKLGEPLDILLREIFLPAENYAVFQDYDCKPKGSTDEWGVCLIHVIPVYGKDSRTWDVNELQFPMDNLWMRTMLSGTLPTTLDDIPLTPGSPIIYKTYGSTPEQNLLQVQKIPSRYEATYAGGVLLSILQRNPFKTQRPLRSFSDIKWESGHITAFTFRDETVQAQRLTLPREEIVCTLETRDGADCPLALKKGARVMDYRLCAPVPLNDFPNPNCRPKTYKFDGKLKAVSELNGLDEALLPQAPSPQSNSIPAWIWLVIALALLVGFFTMTLIRRKRPSKSNS